MRCERERSQGDPKVVVLKVVGVESSFTDTGKMGRERMSGQEYHENHCRPLSLKCPLDFQVEMLSEHLG